MHFHDRDIGARGRAGHVDGPAVAVLRVGVREDGAGDYAVGGDAQGEGWVAGEDVDEAAAVGHARGVDSGAVDAEGALEGVEELVKVEHVVDVVHVGVALPLGNLGICLSTWALWFLHRI